jgi:hypothetical protein
LCVFFKILFILLPALPLATLAQLPTGWHSDTDILTARESTIVFEGNYSCGFTDAYDPYPNLMPGRCSVDDTEQVKNNYLKSQYLQKNA